MVKGIAPHKWGKGMKLNHVVRPPCVLISCRCNSESSRKLRIDERDKAKEADKGRKSYMGGTGRSRQSCYMSHVTSFRQLGGRDPRFQSKITSDFLGGHRTLTSPQKPNTRHGLRRIPVEKIPPLQSLDYGCLFSSHFTPRPPLF